MGKNKGSTDDTFFLEMSHTSYSERQRKTGLPEIADFDEYKDELRQRVILYALHHIEHMTENDWYSCVMFPELMVAFADIAYDSEVHNFPTNKPSTHKALFRETYISFFSSDIRTRGYIQPDGSLAPVHYKKLRAAAPKWTDEEFREYRFEEPDSFVAYKKSIEPQDEELFPEPEPIRVEVAGAILNFTSEEAVVVVYMDCEYVSKEISLSGVYYVACEKDHLNIDLTARVTKRSLGNVTICAAIFSPIPLVTDWHRHHAKAVKHTKCSVYFHPLREDVTLFKGNVTELDWRGRK